MTEIQVKQLSRLADLEQRMATGEADLNELREAEEILDDLGMEWRKLNIRSTFETGQTMNRIEEKLDRIKQKG